MSIRKIWVCVLLDHLGVTGAERVIYERSLALMSEAEAAEVVGLLERAADGAEDGLEKACVAFILRCTKEDDGCERSS